MQLVGRLRRVHREMEGMLMMNLIIEGVTIAGYELLVDIAFRTFLSTVG